MDLSKAKNKLDAKHGILNKDFWEAIFHGIVLIAAVSAILFLFLIIVSIFTEGMQLFRHTSVTDFLFNKLWYPEDKPYSYGILALIWGSFIVTIISLVVAVPMGVGAGIFISEVAPSSIKELLKPIIELLASIPSVIYGLFGMTIMGPAIQRLLGLNTGLNAFSAGLILGLMVIPIVSSITEDAVNAVPRALREASYGLGANKSETIFRVVLPAAKSGVLAGIILGFGRSIGETMVVLMVAGNSAVISLNIFNGARPMTSTIAAEMGEATLDSPHYYALFAIAMVLFIITFFSNILTEYIKGNISHGTKL
jgi:phosphate transport system permease protein